MFGLVSLLVAMNVIFYIPARVLGMRGLYQIGSEPMDIPAEITADDALIAVHTDQWFEYARLLPLVEPFQESDIKIFISRGPDADEHIIRLFPGRQIVHYYPDTPGRLFSEPRNLKNHRNSSVLWDYNRGSVFQIDILRLWPRNIFSREWGRRHSAYNVGGWCGDVELGNRVDSIRKKERGMMS